LGHVVPGRESCEDDTAVVQFWVYDRGSHLDSMPSPHLVSFDNMLMRDREVWDISKTNWFNRAVDRVKDDAQVQELLGDPKKITAYGEQTNNKWAVARPIA
jgi:hypothetical protein